MPCDVCNLLFRPTNAHYINSNVCFFKSYFLLILVYLGVNRLSLHILLYQMVAFVFRNFSKVCCTKYTLLLIYCAFVGLNNKFNGSEDSAVSVFVVAGGGIKSKVDFRIRIEPRTSRARREHEYRSETFDIQMT